MLAGREVTHNKPKHCTAEQSAPANGCPSLLGGWRHLGLNKNGLEFLDVLQGCRPFKLAWPAAKVRCAAAAGRVGPLFAQRQ